jgi:hypothetical protein
MKFRIRDPKGTLKNIEIEADATVEQLRDLVTKEFGASSPKQVRLISKGKLLTDEKVISDTNLEDNDLIMILILKSKVEKEKATAADEEAHKDEINELVEEGFDRQEAISALRRADWDMDAALETLGNGLEAEGIPGQVLPENSIIHMNRDQIDALEDDELEVQLDAAIGHFLTAPEFRSVRE